MFDLPRVDVWLNNGAGAARPNVILVITDDQGYGDLACHGNPVIKTPNIDRLHAESMRLTNYHNSPLCAPTRAALLTGRYNNRTGVWHLLGGHSLLRRDEMTLGDLFTANGYRTALYGKWHLGESYPFRPADRGFGESLIHGGGGIGTTPDYWGNDYFDDTYLRNGKPEQFKGYGTDALFAEAMKFIEANRERPFFCEIATAAPHDPFNVAPNYSEPYIKAGMPENVAKFYGMITNLDENVGRLVSQLDQLNLSHDTILIFMTDNGSVMGERAFNAGMRGGKGSNYEGGHRLPFFIRWPKAGMTGGRDVDRLTAHIDVAPTLIELCGLKSPRPVKFDGMSMASLLKGASQEWPDRLLVVDTQNVRQPIKWRNSAVLTEQWRLINGQELYDIRRDPAQKNDVAAQHPEVVARLRAGYDAWWSDIAPSFADVPHFVVGSQHENPVRLNALDLHGQPAYMQHQVEMAERADGYWSIEVARAGEYEITLRRWPPEVNRPINDELSVMRLTKKGSKPAKIAGAQWARLLVGEQDLTEPLALSATEARFRVKLKAGRTKLQGWFINDQHLSGATFGAYYAGVRLLSAEQVTEVSTSDPRSRKSP